MFLQQFRLSCLSLHRTLDRGIDSGIGPNTYCFVCSLFNQDCRDPAWTTEGVSSWSKMKSRGVGKNGKLSLHFSSENHKTAIQSYLRFQDPFCHIDTMIDRTVRKSKIQEEQDKLENKENIKIFMDIAKTLARQDIAFRGDASEKNGNYNQIVQLLARYCPKFQYWLKNRRNRPFQVSYMSSESQNEIIQVLAEDIRKRVIDEIKEAGMFSVSADTTPDLSKRDQMSVICRYVNEEGQPMERLLSMHKTSSKKGIETATEIISTLQNNSLSTDELCFQSYDFTNSMSGRFKGTQKMLQEKLQREIPYIPCQGHRANTVVEHSCNSSTIIKDMLNILERIYVFFTGSTKRLVEKNFENLLSWKFNYIAYIYKVYIALLYSICICLFMFLYIHRGPPCFHQYPLQN